MASRYRKVFHGIKYNDDENTLNELRCHSRGIAKEPERDIDSFEETTVSTCSKTVETLYMYVEKQGSDGLMLPGFSTFRKEPFVVVPLRILTTKRI